MVKALRRDALAAALIRVATLVPATVVAAEGAEITGPRRPR
ncbi:hypothetical protein ACIGNX_22605 [Actinosynnema sp. NPDC053489]